jgi:hypothetical protein
MPYITGFDINPWPLNRKCYKGESAKDVIVMANSAGTSVNQGVPVDPRCIKVEISKIQTKQLLLQ